MSKAADVQNIVFDIAKTVFDGITPQEQKSLVIKSDVQDHLNQFSAVINSNEAFAYLTVQDGLVAKQIIIQMKTCLRDVFSDSKITFADIPVIINTVKALSLSVNGINDKVDVAIKVGVHTLVPILELILTIVAQMILTPPEFMIVKSIIGPCFDLLVTTVTPLIISKNWTCCS
jgi:hypothetical protein